MKAVFAIPLLAFLALLPMHVDAAELTYQFKEQIFRVQVQTSWRQKIHVSLFRGRELVFDPATESGKSLPVGVTVEERTVWNMPAIMEALEKNIGSVINRPAGSVRINKDEKGNVTFSGSGLSGLSLDTKRAASFTVMALEKNVPLIQLPVEETPPELLVENEELKTLGIRELVTIGESNFAGSPNNRKHNIATGLSRFNGHIIPQGAEFSFNEVLGPVNGKTGYLPELTIVGEKTLPEYGGGLCQVSTTAYRGAWLAGFPITQRKNHSYAVRYYAPEGTDATIYPPSADLRFVNNTSGALLIQTQTIGNKAYFFYYGTKPKNRVTEVFGPFTWGYTTPPPDRIDETTEIPPGERRVVSHRVPGMKTTWYRFITENGEEKKPEEVFSSYQARPNIEEVGIVALPAPFVITVPVDEKSLTEPGEEPPPTIPRRGEKPPSKRG